MHLRLNKSSPLKFFIPVLTLLTYGCAPVGPNFVAPELDPSKRWSEAIDQGLESTSPQLVRWWQVFQDPVLNQLVETAWANNNSLEIAGLRVLESRAQLGVAVGTLYPNQTANGNATYISPPENTGVTSNYWQYALGLNASWEMDFWGRFRRGIESADAAYMASIAAYDQALILLTAQVVDTYTIIRSTEEQLRISQENIGLQQRSYEITETLYRNGQDSGLDMQQANSLLLSTQSTIPALTISLKQARNALATLLGQAPGSINTLLASAQGIPVIPGNVSMGIPADMLRRRPDVRQAELLAIAQNAAVGLAEADLYPSFSLIGSIGLSAGGPGDNDFDNLFDSDAVNYSIGPSFTWPFLSFGRIRNNVRIQDARLQQALVSYRETVLQAARETEDAIAGFNGSKEQSLILAKTVTSSKRSNELSTLRFREGFSDYQRVLDSQQALFSQQQRYITSEADKVRNLIALYKALGGGWEDREGMLLIDDATRQTMEQRTNWGKLLDTNYLETVDPATTDPSTTNPQAGEEKNSIPKPDW